MLLPVTAQNVKTYGDHQTRLAHAIDKTAAHLQDFRFDLALLGLQRVVTQNVWRTLP
jgi:hypothetical protein